MSKALYALRSGDNCIGVVWETKLGKFVTLQGCVDPQMGLIVYDIQSGKEVDYIDIIDVLSEILPIKAVEE